MFESIVFKNTVGPGPLLDVGAIAESLLFYDRVAIVGNSATLKALLAQIPPFITLTLLKDQRIEFYYLADQTGVKTDRTTTGRGLHDLIRFSSPQHTIEKVGPEVFKAAAGSTGQAKIGASQFTHHLRPLDHAGFDQKAVLQALLDHNATESSVRALVELSAPGFAPSKPLRFRIEQQVQGFLVDTNIDFDSLNQTYHQLVPQEHSSLSEAYFLTLIQGAYEATYYAATLDSEVAVAPIEQVVHATAVESIVRRHMQSTSQISSFVDLTMRDGRAIREAVNSGHVSFAQVLKLLDSADRFRHWLREQPIDAELLHSYYQSIVSDSWADKLPGKSARWAVFTGLGLAADALGTAPWGTIGGVAISAVDSFLADKLVKGWKPHQFVEGKLKAAFSKEELAGVSKPK